jgi:hypothetical protein
MLKFHRLSPNYQQYAVTNVRADANGSRSVAGAACFFIILGAKLWLIHSAGNSTPFWDEWDEADFIFKPYIEGRLTVADFFRTHNEHVILWTRLLMLGVLKLSGYWDVVLQMIVNALIHAAVVAVIVARLSRILDPPRAIFALVACGTLNAIPFSYESTLWGFNNQFYLLIGFSFASIACFNGSIAWSPRWWLGTLLATMSFLSGASGALTLSAAIGLFLLQILCGRRAGLREWLGIVAHAALMLALALSVPKMPGHEALRAHGVGEFLSAFAAIASWPAKPPLCLVIYAPVVVFSVRVLRNPPKLADDQWFNIAAFGWILIQFAALALGRAKGAPLSSRYLDILQIGIAVSIVSTLSLMPAHPRLATLRRGMPAAVVVWFLFLAFWAGRDAYLHLKRPIEVRQQTAIIETGNLRGYLGTGDSSYVTNKPIFDIPYPSAERLRGLLDDAAIRSVLPPSLSSDAAHNGVIESVKMALLQLPYFFVGLGIMSFLAAVRFSSCGGTERDGVKRDQRVCCMPHVVKIVSRRGQDAGRGADKYDTPRGSSETGPGEPQAKSPMKNR